MKINEAGEEGQGGGGVSFAAEFEIRCHIRMCANAGLVHVLIGTATSTA